MKAVLSMWFSASAGVRTDGDTKETENGRESQNKQEIELKKGVHHTFHQIQHSISEDLLSEIVHDLICHNAPTTSVTVMQ